MSPPILPIPVSRTRPGMASSIIPKGCSYRYPLLLLLVGVLVLGPALAQASASGSDDGQLHLTGPSTSSSSSSGPLVRRARNRKEIKACGFEGDADMYGLGIRIGYYIQWIATVFAAYFTPKVVSGAFEANAIFNIGMLAGLVYTTIARDDMYVVEPVMVLGFSVGGAIVGLLDPKNVHDAKNLKSLRARLVHLAGTGALSLPLLIYWIWYSFYGMDTMAYNPCSTSTFFIVKINIWETWFRVFMKVATIMSIVGLFSLAVAVIISYRIKSHELPHGTDSSSGLSGVPRMRASTSTPRLSRTTTALALRARPTKLQFMIVIVSLVICGLSVELSIIWNNITGVNILGATGQLIPMAIGIVTSFRVVLGILNHQAKSKKEKRRAGIDRDMFGGGGEMMRVGRGGGLLAFAGDDDPNTIDNTAAMSTTIISEKRPGVVSMHGGEGSGGVGGAQPSRRDSSSRSRSSSEEGDGAATLTNTPIGGPAGTGAGAGAAVSRSVKLSDNITTITANTTNYTYSNSIRSTTKRHSVVSISTDPDNMYPPPPPLPAGPTTPSSASFVKPHKISPSSTSDSNGSMTFTPTPPVRPGSMRSGISMGLGPLPPAPSIANSAGTSNSTAAAAAAAAAAALTQLGSGASVSGQLGTSTPTVGGSSIMSKSGRKKLQRKWKG